MPNYRHNAMPYNTCRPMPAPMPAVRKPCSEDMVLAMAYVPWQSWREIYDAEKGLQNGTIFKELNLPFYGKGGMKR